MKNMSPIMNVKISSFVGVLTLLATLSAHCMNPPTDEGVVLGSFGRFPADVRAYFYQHHAPVRLLSQASKTLLLDMQAQAKKFPGLRIKIDSILMQPKVGKDNVLPSANDFVKVISNPVSFVSGVEIDFSRYGTEQVLSTESMMILLCNDHIKRVVLFTSELKKTEKRATDLNSVLKAANEKGKLCSLTLSDDFGVDVDTPLILFQNRKLRYLNISDAWDFESRLDYETRHVVSRVLEPYICLRQNDPKVHPRDAYEMQQLTLGAIIELRQGGSNMKMPSQRYEEYRQQLEYRYNTFAFRMEDPLVERLHAENERLGQKNAREDAIERTIPIHLVVSYDDLKKKETPKKSALITLREGMLRGEFVKRLIDALEPDYRINFHVVLGNQLIYHDARYTGFKTERIDFIHQLKDGDELTCVMMPRETPFKNYYDGKTVDTQ